MTDTNEVIMPYQFLKVVSLAGLMSDFTKIIIDKALSTLTKQKLQVSINITGEDLQENYLIEYLESKREEYDLKSSQIILEILESMSITNEEKILRQLKELKNLGYKLAIDDFGTENSNFSRLLTLDVDFIKIDGSFIKNIDTNSNSQEIVKSIVSFAHNIGCGVVAEYVWSKKVYDTIKEFDVDFAQGYYIAKPDKKLQGGENNEK